MVLDHRGREARLHAARSETAEARRYLARALALQPSDPALLSLQRQLETPLE